MVDGLQSGTQLPACVPGVELEVDVERSVRAQLDRNEIDRAAVRRPNGRNPELARPERGVHSRTLQRGRPIQRPDRVIGAQSCGADRRATLVEVRACRRVWLRVEDEIDVALTQERHVLGTMLSGIAEAETFDKRAQRASRVLVHGKFEK